MKKQEGNYFDSFLKLDVDYDKRNQKFQTSDGFRSYYSVDFLKDSSLKAFVKYLKQQKIDILVNNAGMNKIGEFSNINNPAPTITFHVRNHCLT